MDDDKPTKHLISLLCVELGPIREDSKFHDKIIQLTTAMSKEYCLQNKTLLF